MAHFRNACALVFLCIATSASAQSATPVSYPGFTLDYVDQVTFTGGQFPALSFVSSVNGVTTFSLPELAHGASLTDTLQHGVEYLLHAGFTAAPGYRIAGITLTGTLRGTRMVEPLPPGLGPEAMATPGVAQNGTWTKFVWTGYGLRGYPYSEGSTYSNLEGDLPVAVALQNAQDARQLGVMLYSFVYVDAWSGQYWEGDRQIRLDARATIEFLDPTLTVHAEMIPIPEPGMAWMLVAGLGAIAVVARRRRGLSLPD